MMDQLGLIDSSRKLVYSCVISFLISSYLVLLVSFRMSDMTRTKLQFPDQTPLGFATVLSNDLLVYLRSFILLYFFFVPMNWHERDYVHFIDKEECVLLPAYWCQLAPSCNPFDQSCINLNLHVRRILASLDRIQIDVRSVRLAYSRTFSASHNKSANSTFNHTL